MYYVISVGRCDLPNMIQHEVSAVCLCDHFWPVWGKTMKLSLLATSFGQCNIIVSIQNTISDQLLDKWRCYIHCQGPCLDCCCWLTIGVIPINYKDPNSHHSYISIQGHPGCCTVVHTYLYGYWDFKLLIYISFLFKVMYMKFVWNMLEWFTTYNNYVGWLYLIGNYFQLWQILAL